MKNRRFKDWINGVKSLIEKRTEKVKHAYIAVWETHNTSDTFTIHIMFSNELKFCMSFSRMEHNRNKPGQRKKLAVYRRKNMAREMRDFAEELVKVAKVLER